MFKKKPRFLALNSLDTELFTLVISSIFSTIYSDFSVSDKIKVVNGHLTFLRNVFNINLERTYFYEKILQQSK